VVRRKSLTALAPLTNASSISSLTWLNTRQVIFFTLIFSIGPGSYKQYDDFVNNKYNPNYDEGGTSYIVKDNGHINQRPQMYAANRSGREGLFVSTVQENPGPGAYEQPSFVDTSAIKSMNKKGNFN